MKKNKHFLSIYAFTLFAMLFLSIGYAQNDPQVEGELKRWHKVTLNFNGPNTSETANPNPFSDYRLEVTFTHSGSNRSFKVPGYFAACGNAENTSCTSGNKWKVHFTPDQTGAWNWSATFKQGSNVAINRGGNGAGFMDGKNGAINISESNKSGRDFRGKDLGMLTYVGEHYLRHVGTNPSNPNGPWFIKAGADSPENALAYDDFDSTPGKKSWSPHQQDYEASDASGYIWSGGKGTELLGAINYLSKKGVNAFSFLTFSLNGDDKSVSPHVFDNENNPDWNNNVQKDRFDVSKLAQWEKIFEYADKKGMFLHFKTLETENEKLMDGGSLGRERKLYYRELIARFGHHLALNWNLAEESTLSADVIINVANYVRDLDPYNHLIVLHTGLNNQNSKYAPLLGNQSEVNGASIQSNKSVIHAKVKEWVEKSKNANKKWIVSNDEQGPSDVGVAPDSYGQRKETRNVVLWATLLAGGMGVEYYYGYQTGETDLSAENHRSRDLTYSDAFRALRFFNSYLKDDLISMTSADGVTADGKDYVFAKSGEIYAIYRPNGGSTGLSLPNGNNKYNVQWYNPREGSGLTSKTVLGNQLIAPNDNDWVALITLNDGNNDTDDDGDGVINSEDLCPNTPDGESVDENGCGESQKDDDNDGVFNDKDQCPNTPDGETVGADGCFEPQEDCIALEQNGIVAVEAEHFVSQSKDANRKWYQADSNASTPTPDPDPSHHEGASEETYLEILPDTRVTGNDPLINGVSFSNTPGQVAIIDYKIKFNTPGKYFVWVRANSTGTEDNGIHVGIDGVWPESGQRMQWCEGKNEWTWASKQRTETNHCGEEQKIFLNVPTAGIHTISFSMREDGFEMDKFVLSKEYKKPVGLGPSEVLTACGDSNTPPEIAITSPTQDNSFNVGDTINIEADATDTDGTIAKVEFFVDDVLVETDTTAPYVITTSRDVAGSYVITAKATDDNGDSKTSEEVRITVEDDAPNDGIVIPGIFEAEDFSSKTGSVRVRTNNPQASGNSNLGYIVNGDKVSYDVDVKETGVYSFDLYTSSNGVGGTVTISADGEIIAVAQIPVNGAWQNYQKITINADRSIEKGKQSLELLFQGKNGYLFNIDKISAQPISGPSGTSNTIALPGVFEAEDLSSKTGSVRVENHPQASGNQNLGYIENGDRVFYDVDVKETGFYSFYLYASSNGVGGTVVISADGEIIAVAQIPVNGAWQNYQKITINADRSIEKGKQSLELLFKGRDGYLFNIDKISTQPISAQDESCQAPCEDSTKSNVIVYPNPVKSMLNIDNASKVDKIQIFDLNGILKEEILISKNQNQIDLSNYQNGTFILRIIEKGKVTSKVILKN